MVKIRLRRMGAKKNPYYRIIVADSKAPRDGRFIEEIGTYDPLMSPSEITVNMERAQYWIKSGAQPTDTVKALLKKSGVSLKVSKAKRSVKKVAPPPPVKEEPKPKAEPKAEPKVEEPKAEEPVAEEPVAEEAAAEIAEEAAAEEAAPEAAAEPVEEAVEEPAAEPAEEAAAEE